MNRQRHERAEQLRDAEDVKLQRQIESIVNTGYNLAHNAKVTEWLLSKGYLELDNISSDDLLTYLRFWNTLADIMKDYPLLQLNKNEGEKP